MRMKLTYHSLKVKPTQIIRYLREWFTGTWYSHMRLYIRWKTQKSTQAWNSKTIRVETNIWGWKWYTLNFPASKIKSIVCGSPWMGPFTIIIFKWWWGYYGCRAEKCNQMKVRSNNGTTVPTTASTWPNSSNNILRLADIIDETGSVVFTERGAYVVQEARIMKLQLRKICWPDWFTERTVWRKV